MKIKEFIEKHQRLPVEEYPNRVPARPVVSVCIQTYQHAPFIQQCLEGILMQEAGFNYEILLGEDASTDGTREICLEYANKYPKRIRLFLHHRENNIPLAGLPTSRFNTFYNFGHARGRYIAICEGDDYWTVPHKLSKQVDFLTCHPDFSVSFHPVARHYNDDPGKKSIFAPGPPSNGSDYTMEDVILQGGGLMPTNSMVFPVNGLADFPEWATGAPVGDTPLALVLASRGRLHYMDDVMGAYRVNSAGSWSEKMRDSRLQKLKYQGMSTMWDRFDQWTDGKYHQQVSKTQRQLTYRYYKFRVKRYGRTLYDSLVGS